jgi:hypothetical protein
VRVVVADREAVERHEQAFRRRDPASHHDPLAVLDREARQEQCVEPVPTERLDGVVAADRNLQEEQPDRVAERRVRQPPLEDRNVRETRGRAVVAEQLDDRLLGEGQRAQSTTDRVSGAGVRNGIPVLSDAASCLCFRKPARRTVSAPQRAR